MGNGNATADYAIRLSIHISTAPGMELAGKPRSKSRLRQAGAAEKEETEKLVSKLVSKRSMEVEFQAWRTSGAASSCMWNGTSCT